MVTCEGLSLWKPCPRILKSIATLQKLSRIQSLVAATRPSPSISYPPRLLITYLRSILNYDCSHKKIRFDLKYYLGAHEVDYLRGCADADVAAMSANMIDVVVQRLSSPETGMLILRIIGGLSPWLINYANYHIVLDVKLKVEGATQLRDNLEVYTNGQFYPTFLKKLIPVFVNILKGQPVFISTSGEQVDLPMRHCVHLLT
jgi:hypothetical protein